MILIFRLVTAAVTGGCCGGAITQFLKGNIGVGLSLFTIGFLFAILYITTWIKER